MARRLDPQTAAYLMPMLQGNGYNPLQNFDPAAMQPQIDRMLRSLGVFRQPQQQQGSRLDNVQFKGLDAYAAMNRNNVQQGSLNAGLPSVVSRGQTATPGRSYGVLPGGAAGPTMTQTPIAGTADMQQMARDRAAFAANPRAFSAALQGPVGKGVNPPYVVNGQMTAQGREHYGEPGSPGWAYPAAKFGGTGTTLGRDLNRATANVGNQAKYALQNVMGGVNAFTSKLPVQLQHLQNMQRMGVLRQNNMYGAAQHANSLEEEQSAEAGYSPYMQNKFATAGVNGPQRQQALLDRYKQMFGGALGGAQQQALSNAKPFSNITHGNAQQQAMFEIIRRLKPLIKAR